MKIPASSFFVILFCFVLVSCESDEIPVSTESAVLTLHIEFHKSVFNTTIEGTNIKLTRKLPFATSEVEIKNILVSKNAHTDKNIGDILVVGNDPIPITVVAEDGVSQQTYQLILELSEFSSIVEEHGLLSVYENKIVDKNNSPICLAGNSFFWSNDGWGGERFYNPSVVSWLKLDWGTTLVRAALGVDDSGGFIEKSISNKNKVVRVIDAAIDEGLYVIIDWHSHHAEDYVEEAVTFFSEMAGLYGEYDNVIYEIYNEPLSISWSETVKPYAITVISAIREIDPDNLIVVGSPEWSQRVDLAAADPIIEFENIAYSLHFYSVNHKQWLRDRADKALSEGIALFVTEWGPTGYTLDDPETEIWMEWCKQNQISHCSWAVNDKEEEWSIVKPGMSTIGEWTIDNLTAAGILTRRIIREW